LSNLSRLSSMSEFPINFFNHRSKKDLSQEW
jgi:hypothetical protein